MYDETRGAGFHSLPTLPREVIDACALAVIDNPGAARCPQHEGDRDSVPCVNCGGVRRRAEVLRRERDGAAGEARDARRAEIRACGLCDHRGFAAFSFPDGSPVALRCPHVEAELMAEADQVTRQWEHDRAVAERGGRGDPDWFPGVVARLEKITARKRPLGGRGEAGTP